MRILFVANHVPHDNDDEGAIAYALEQLGHEVLCLEERPHLRGQHIEAIQADLCLFLKWPTAHLEIRHLQMPAVFWYFDKVEADDDPTLKARSDSRVRWFDQVQPLCKGGFCTDGDWATKRGLYHLMQGADERVVGPGQGAELHRQQLPEHLRGPEIAFFGMVNHGQQRAQHITQLRGRYGRNFHVVGDGGPRTRVHGRQFADILARTVVCIAPDGPNTDQYWSNRVYQVLGFAGFLVHPYCRGLLQHYTPEELVTYKTRKECTELIDSYLTTPALRASIARRGYKRTVREHLYRHRVEQLLCKMSSTPITGNGASR